MTAPRQHLPDQLVFITRRTSERRFFLLPDAEVAELTSYALARAANRHGQTIHGVTVMSNHIHLVITDNTGERSNMARDSFASIARARNKALQRKGHFWEAGTYCDCVLLDQDASDRKLIYTLLNPVRAGLVDHLEEWPGFMIQPKDWGTTMRIPRPARFIGDDAPEFIELKPEPPPGYEEWPLAKTINHFEALIEEARLEILAEREAQNTTLEFATKDRLEIDPYSSPNTPTPARSFIPRFATLDGELMSRAEAARRDFLEAYIFQRNRWKDGERDCVFPCGTIALRRNSGVTCAPAPPDNPLTQVARIARIKRYARTCLLNS
ncbi:hypothetical protein FRC98_10455 [Lujinxingia vulgaris]|uniref:Transposase IS200-like domain-containing protein n=1 Tax=Lujinxingia vulgaris TaxID=2600176 RepID=A0A5C6XBP8_9DELT|nr:transposase [Lujinxingia vulgaris]TXD37147.1 hypothetical protein FRC98_10455 [Lujinxingia vulgaris]